MVRLHSTQTKKLYKKPLLAKKGNVAKITKGGAGGSSDNFQTQKNA